MLGSPYDTRAEPSGPCSGVNTSTRTVPFPRGVTQASDVVLTRESGITVHGASPNSTTTDQGGSGNPEPVRAMRAPPAVPTGPAVDTDVTDGAGYRSGSTTVVLWPPAVTRTIAPLSRPGGARHTMPVGLHSNTGHSTSAVTRADNGCQVRVVSLKVSPFAGAGGAVRHWP